MNPKRGKLQYSSFVFDNTLMALSFSDMFKGGI